MMTFESQAECTDQADKEYEHGCVTRIRSYNVLIKNQKLDCIKQLRNVDMEANDTRIRS
jgi:hypothetical protein